MPLFDPHRSASVPLPWAGEGAFMTEPANGVRHVENNGNGDEMAFVVCGFELLVVL
jgi:hypothetical protein